jgi:hypothetical protein
MKFLSVPYLVFPSSLPRILLSVSKGNLAVSTFGMSIQLFLSRYGLVTEQKKGMYKYFVDLGDRMEVATVRTVYIDEVRSKSFSVHIF